METTVLLRMDHISKSFGGVKALKDVGFSLDVGEIHALCGENGAGKSTLMKILDGIIESDDGMILMQDDSGRMSDVKIKSPSMAQRLGISMVFQEFNLLNNMSIRDNIFLGRVPIKKGTAIIDCERMEQESQEVLKKVNLNLSTEILVGELSCGQKQLLEIARALSFKARIIIFDEPTASLTDNEASVLFSLIRQLKEQRVTIVYISHRMKEIFQLSDRITVFRDGMFIKTLETEETDVEEIVSLMIGKSLGNRPEVMMNSTAHRDEFALHVEKLKAFKNSPPVNFSLYKGEVLGFWGLMGAGRTELARQIFGIDGHGDARISVFGKEVAIDCVRDAMAAGMGFIPEDRKKFGLILGMSVKDNMLLSFLTQMKGVRLRGQSMESQVGKYAERLGIVYENENTLVRNLSGGNQQKVVLAKWLVLAPRILILDEPTRGIDVGAKDEIYRLISELSEQGISIIFISSEIDEVITVCSRVIVMHEGEIRGELEGNEITPETIMRMGIGA